MLPARCRDTHGKFQLLMGLRQKIEQLNPEVKSMGNIARPGTPTEMTAGNRA